jgi:hypothetical protein
MKLKEKLPSATTREISGGRLFTIQHEDCKEEQRRKDAKILPSMFPNRMKRMIGQTITCSCGCQLTVTKHIKFSDQL